MLTRVVVTGLVASGLLLAGQAALAGGHGHHHGHGKKWQPVVHHHGPASEYAYARVVDVDPIVHRVRVSARARAPSVFLSQPLYSVLPIRAA